MKDKLEKINDYEWILPKSTRKEMKVAGKLIANKAIYEAMEDGAIEQLSNVCCLPGVIEPVVALPDAHFGYGLPMGAVAAFDAEEGIISAGLCGFDINCGVNSIRTNLTYGEVKEKLKELINALYDNVPVGVGSKGKLRLTQNEIDDVLKDGCEWAVEKGYGTKEDLKRLEENGKMEGADPSKVSKTAKQRGFPQLGTLGSGNHFLELQKITNIFDEKKAKEWGIKDKDQVVIMLHCGSRGLGHQVATDYLQIQEKAVEKYKIWIPDKQLACAPANSKEGQDYFAAMKCAVNYSFTNRLVMTQWIRETFEKVFKKDWESMDMHTIYGICHNVVKLEEHKLKEGKRKLYVHRKGATRAFPDVPVLLAGSMGTASYILKGTETAMQKTFGSSAHGAGRAASRHGALRQFRGEDVQRKLLAKGIVSKAPSPKSLAEEAPEAYKDVEEVIDTVHKSGISLKVCRMEPLGVIKG
jgi:tRNA-splicing ligase RtcB (3'-phosphate/5'-hydroxy nucleic acid ligase)